MASLLLAAAAPPLLSRLPSTSSKASSFSFSFSHSEAFGSPLYAPVASLSTSASSSSYPSPIPSGSVYCGRGDRKTEKGKRFNHSYGNARPHGKKKGRGPLRPYAPPAPSKKDRFEDNEIVKIEIDED